MSLMSKQFDRSLGGVEKYMKRGNEKKKYIFK
jgi:hypothetical protein